MKWIQYSVTPSLGISTLWFFFFFAVGKQWFQKLKLAFPQCYLHEMKTNEIWCPELLSKLSCLFGLLTLLVFGVLKIFHLKYCSSLLNNSFSIDSILFPIHPAHWCQVILLKFYLISSFPNYQIFHTSSNCPQYKILNPFKKCINRDGLKTVV